MYCIGNIRQLAINFGFSQILAVNLVSKHHSA